MCEMASFWSYEENHDMEQLGEKLMCTTLELEKLKAEAVDEMRKNKEYIKQLIHLLKSAIQERDEARNQFQKLLNKTMAAEAFPSLPLSPLLKPAKPNSSITESNSIHSHASTPVDSLFDAVSSPTANNHPFPVAGSCIDEASLIIDNLAKGKVLPPKGKLLQAVLQPGPLLQTLLVAGPLPTWRNPPQFQPFQIPPFSIKGGELAEVFQHKPVSNLGQLPYAQLSCASAQVQSSSMLGFANLVSGSSTINTNGYAPLPKRQRFS